LGFPHKEANAMFHSANLQLFFKLAADSENVFAEKQELVSIE
jgi:hypothetical protein